MPAAKSRLDDQRKPDLIEGAPAERVIETAHSNRWFKQSHPQGNRARTTQGGEARR
jgi:hypothetical protein